MQGSNNNVSSLLLILPSLWQNIRSILSFSSYIFVYVKTDSLYHVITLIELKPQKLSHTNLMFLFIFTYIYSWNVFNKRP